MGTGMRESHTKLHIRKGSGGGKKDNIRGSIGQTKKRGGGGNRIKLARGFIAASFY